VREKNFWQNENDQVVTFPYLEAADKIERK
jgi:hypothetical protein